MSPETSYLQSGYAGYDYFIANFHKLKESFPKVSDEILVSAASTMSIACALEQIASNLGGHCQGPLNKALEAIADQSLAISTSTDAPIQVEKV